MKKLLIVFFLASLLSACRSSKKAITSTSKELTQLETPKIKHQEKPISKKDTLIISTTEVLDTLKVNKSSEFETVGFNETFNHNNFNELLQKYVSSEGAVNYKGIKKERSRLTDYISSLANNMPNDTWIKEEKLAYWINAYNAFTIDLILKHYPISSIKDIKDPWKLRYWQIGEKWYNLDEIEHQIIRKMGEPRIHFALVCAAVSCPKLYNKAFTAATLEEDLSKLTREFLADTSKNTISENNLQLSKIFSWFTKDFKQDGSLIDFLNNYTDITISNNAKKQFNNYNWDLNE